MKARFLAGALIFSAFSAALPGVGTRKTSIPLTWAIRWGAGRGTRWWWTLVGLNDETWLGGGNQGPRNATLHSDKEHVIERWTRTGDDLTYEATVEDPVMFTKPWVMAPQHSHIAAPGDYIQPTMCLNNDRAHLVPPDKN